ncbi:MAG: type III pantothenate kinase [Bacillota bacterium]
MFLACDLGNTFAKFCVYEGDKTVRLWKSKYEDYDSEAFSQFPITGAGISSVVTEFTQIVASDIRNKFDIDPFIIDHNARFNIKINYLTPRTLGIDRICSVEGAFSIFRSDPEFLNYNEKTFLVTVDLGTATTINIVKYNAEFSGGIITPGLTTMVKSLFTNTARLPEIDLKNDYKGFWGVDTHSSIASGIINSAVSIIEKSLMQLKNIDGAEKIKLFITGGNSEVILNYLPMEFVFVNDLVLRGVKAIYERNFVD